MLRTLCIYLIKTLFRNLGMSYLLGEDWQKYFDVVIASAKKPIFFVDKMRPFREHLRDGGVTCWKPVKFLEKGKVYLEVCKWLFIC